MRLPSLNWEEDVSPQWKMIDEDGKKKKKVFTIDRRLSDIEAVCVVMHCFIYSY